MKNRKVINILIALFSCITLISVGFASWTIVNESITSIFGDITAENINNSSSIKLLNYSINGQNSDVSLNENGIIVDEIFENDININTLIEIKSSKLLEKDIELEIRLLFTGINADISSTLKNITLTNGYLSTSFANSFGPYANNTQEYIAHVFINKQTINSVNSNIEISFQNLYQFISQNKINLNMKIRQL